MECAAPREQCAGRSYKLHRRRVDIADIGTDGDGDGNRAGIRAAPAKRGDAPVCRLQPLESGDHSNFALTKPLAQQAAIDLGNAGGAMRRISVYGDLPTLP